MRKRLLMLVIVTIILIPVFAYASGCQDYHTVVGTIQPVKVPPPKELPEKGAVLYWLFHAWCPSCEREAGVIKAFRERYRNDVQVYAVPLSGSDQEVQRFLAGKGLSTLPVLREASGAFGAIPTHPVLVFRKSGPVYFRINGYTQLADLEQLYKTFKQR